MGHSAKVAQSDRDRKQRELDGLLARDKELDVLFERLYEDNVSGKIDDTRFSKMSKRYEQEQGENAAKIKALKLELKKSGGQQLTTDLFLDNVRRYTGAQTLTQRMVTELIDHIDVPLKNGRTGSPPADRHSCNCIGAFTVPDRGDIPRWMSDGNERRGCQL